LLANLGTLAQSPGQERTAAAAAAGLQQALIEWDAVDGEVAVNVLTKLPASLNVAPVIAERANEQLTKMSAKPSPELLNLLASLDRRGKAPRSRPLVKLLEADRYVLAFTRRALEDRLLTDTKHFDGTVSLLREADYVVVKARLDEILTACLASRHPDLGPAVLGSVKAGLARLLVDRWAATLGTRDPVRDGLWCVQCLNDAHLPQKLADQLAAAVRDYARMLPRQICDTWYSDVRGELWPAMRPVWDELFVQEAPRGRHNLWINRDGGR
jgi:hypothetical protein